MTGTVVHSRSDVPRGSARWTLALLTIAMGVNQLDRGVVAILLPAIKRDMALSDTALGLLTGLGFALVYSIASLPVGRLADRANRVTIVSIGMAFYSAMAALMGFAGNIWQLLAARSAIAVGEASGGAPSSSLVADLFPGKNRARAIGVWSSGTYLGLTIGLAAGGWINQHYGWRAALWATAVPGIILAILLKLTGHEPRSDRLKDRRVEDVDRRPEMRGAIRELVTPSFLIVLLAVMNATFVNYAFAAWVPSLLSRVDGFDEATVGLVAGASKGLLGLCGVLGGGLLAHYAARERHSRLGAIAGASSLLIVPSMLLFLFATSKGYSLFGLAVGSLFIPMYQAPSFTLIQGIVSPKNKAFAMAVVFTCSSLFGLGLGPLGVGALSDVFSVGYHAAGLRYALLLPIGFSMVCAILFFIAANRLKSVRR